MVEEWCGPDAQGRLIPLTLIPLWDAELAAAEVRRNAARGVRAVAFSEIPPHLGLPSVHSDDWDPFLAACDETGTVIAMHIGSSSRMPSTSADAPPAVGSTITFANCCFSMVDWLMSGKFERFPNLKVMYAEGQIGWPTSSGRRTAAGAASPTRSTARRPNSSPSTSTAASSTTPSG
jgi:predicted TIM-barrel fold metal-dependent hydrolase